MTPTKNMQENNNEELIKKVIVAEWEMFHNVPNIGGTAPCQEDSLTFENHRHSQAIEWSKEALESYLIDLSNAKANNRNLMTEKYGRMMESTSPQEYSKIEGLLPPLNSKILPLIENILKIELKWQEEIITKFPNVLKRGRPLHSSQDTYYITSFETYLRAELSTYSLKTLKLYYKNILKLSSENINGAEVSLEYLVKKYNYQSASEANRLLGSAS
jgi:hypothetical protein